MIPSSWVWSLASTGLVATQLVSIFSLASWRQSGWGCRELAPAATRIAVLVNPTDAVRTESNLKEVDTAARAIGLQVHIVNASTIAEIDAAFATLVRERLDAIFVVPDSFFNSRRVQLANLAARCALSSAVGQREYCEVGGLMSDGTNLADARRQIGSYAGRIL